MQQFFNIFLLVFLSATFSLAQTYSIEGKISGSAHYPISGVNIYLENTASGTTSAENGYYKISDLPGAEYTLIFSFVGYAEQKQTFSLNQDTTLNVTLSQAILDGPIVTTIATQAQGRETAITYSSIQKKELDKQYSTQDIPELLSELPSTTFYSDGGNGVGYNYISIRGFGQRRISVLVNGIPQNDPEDHNNYWHNYSDLTSNIQTIQVQRGAGNAFYGPPAIGGSINIKTDHFSPDFKIDASFGMGSFNTRKSYFALNSGLLADKYILYGRFSKIESDGYRDRSWVDFTTFFLGAARYDDNSNLRIHFYGGPIKDGLSYNGLPKIFNKDSKKRKYNWSYFGLDESEKTVTYFGERRKDEVENFNQPHLEVLHEWQLSKRFTLNNNFFYVKGYGYFDYDGSWGSESYFRLTPEFGYSVDSIPGDALIRAFVDNDQIGWLPQLTVKTEKGTMLFGAELRHHRSLHWGRLQKGSGLPDEVVGNGARRYYQYNGGKDVISLYYHQNYEWYEDITLQADLQYAWKRYHIFDEKFLGNDFSVPYNFINPRIGINYNLSPQTNTYFSLYSTTREPRLKNLYDAAEASTPESWGPVVPKFSLNSDSTINFDKPLVKPEILTGMEFGFGYNSQKLSGALNFYYMDFRDEIIKSGQIDRFGQPVTGNAERTVHYGIELSGGYTPLPQISISGNLSYSKNELKKYSQFKSENEEIILDGNPIAGFPDLLANARVSYNWQEVFVSLSAKYVGESYTDNLKDSKNKLDAYSVINFDANYNFKQIGFKYITLQARINNLLDKKYLAFGEGNAFFPAAGINYFTTLKISL
ncbi:MAG: TonB-dependent receptor [Calditrichaeota bacterium]|nr:TonB-dependent receptor [Calditrichota bacterium]